MRLSLFMRLRAGPLLLLLFTIMLIVFLAYRGLFENFELFPPSPDAVYPRPVVELFSRQDYEVASGGNAPGVIKLTIRLSNNGSEPSIRGAFAAGVLVVLKGARVDGYDLGEFSGIIGVSEDGSIINPVNSSIVELFADKIGPWQSISAVLHVVAENKSDCVLIAYRGWIIDEDDVVVEPISGAKEHYIARFPAEEYPDNPPDSRWAGKDFMKYKLHEASICFKR